MIEKLDVTLFPIRGRGDNKITAINLNICYDPECPILDLSFGFRTCKLILMTLKRKVYFHFPDPVHNNITFYFTRKV